MATRIEPLVRIDTGMLHQTNRIPSIPRGALSADATAELNRRIHAAFCVTSVAEHLYFNNRDPLLLDPRMKAPEKKSMADVLVELADTFDNSSGNQTRLWHSHGTTPADANEAWDRVVFLLTGAHGERSQVKSFLKTTFPLPPESPWFEVELASADAELSGAVHMLFQSLTLLRESSPSQYQDFVTEDLKLWGPKKRFGIRWEQRLTEMLERVPTGLGYTIPIQGLNKFPPAPWGDRAKIDVNLGNGLLPVWVHREPDLSITQGSVTRHTLRPGKRGEDLLNQEQAVFLRDFIRDVVVPRVAKTGDKAMVAHLSVDQIGAGGQVGLAKLMSSINLGRYSTLGALGTGPHPISGADSPLTISLATELLERAHQDYARGVSHSEALELLVDTILHESNHALDSRDGRLAKIFCKINQDIPHQDRKRYQDHVAEMSAYGRVAACFDGVFVPDPSNCWSGAFIYHYSLGDGNRVATAKTTSLFNMSIGTHTFAGIQANSQSNPFEEYCRRLLGNS